MANLTLAIDDELLQLARIRAIEQGTSVNALVRDYLEGMVGGVNQRDVVRKLSKLAEGTRAGSGAKGRTWTRDELYER